MERKNEYKEFKSWIIRKFRLKGSWSWAKKQMRAGKMVRCESWAGALKLRIDNNENTLLQSCFRRKPEAPENGAQLWSTSNHFLDYEDFTDYEVFEWENNQNK